MVNAVIRRIWRDHADDGERSTAFGIEYWIGTTMATGHEQEPDEAQRLAPGPPGSGRRSPAPANGRTRATKRPPTLPSRPRSKASRPNSLLDVQVLEDGAGEQPEADGGEGDQHRVQRADLLEPGERRLDRDRRGPGVDDLAEHVLHLELAAGGSGIRKARNGERERREAEQEEGPPPPVVATGERGDAADERRADRADQQARAHRGGADPTADADRVGVGEQRAVDRACWRTWRSRRRTGRRTA